MKQKRKIGNIYIQSADTFLDYLHKISRDLRKNHADVTFEELNIKKMIAAAKRKSEKPRTNVKL